jgi:hypothetical protein
MSENRENDMVKATVGSLGEMTARDFVSVQPMTTRVGEVFHIKHVDDTVPEVMKKVGVYWLDDPYERISDYAYTPVSPWILDMMVDPFDQMGISFRALRHKTKWVEGDTMEAFTSKHWGFLSGRAGLCVIRDNKVVASWVIQMS